mgnify:CR=1 FL=1
MNEIYDADLASTIKSTIWGDLLTADKKERPLLAHYTSMENAEKILTGGELWFSNPRNMNDWDEMRHGIELLQFLARTQFDRHLGTGSDSITKVLSALIANIEQCIKDFETYGAPDTYVFCFAEHEPDDNDGVLSMWRGYGNGGSGVAIVFDGTRVPEIEGHALVLFPVEYGSEADRRTYVERILDAATRLALQWDAPKDIEMIAQNLVDRVIVATLFSKHKGFESEREWRAVYRPEWDAEGRFESLLGYHHGSGLMEPRLKLPIDKIPGFPEGALSIETLVSKILLGPVAAKDLVLHAFRRMLVEKKLDPLIVRTTASRIPFRG